MGKNTLPSRMPVLQTMGPKIDLSDEATLITQLWMLEDGDMETSAVPMHNAEPPDHMYDCELAPEAAEMQAR